MDELTFDRAVHTGISRRIHQCEFRYCVQPHERTSEKSVAPIQTVPQIPVQTTAANSNN